MTQKTLSKLNPDAFSRFQIVCNEIKLSYPRKRIKILDIGGASNHLYNFLKANRINFDLTIVDIVDFPGKPKDATLIIQSAEKLIFSDNSFDVVVGIDMLEHIPTKKMKQNIVKEAIRVSKNQIIFAGPFESQSVTHYEQRLNKQNKILFGVDQKWLAEHFKYGKPTKDLLKNCFSEANLSPRIFSALPLSEWYTTSIVNMTLATNSSISPQKVRDLNQEYNLQFLDKKYFITDECMTQEGYRTFIVCEKTSKHRQVSSVLVENENMLIERYIDVMVGGLFKTKDNKAIRNHLAWYKGELEKLKKTNTELRKENEELKNHLKGVKHRIIRNAKSLNTHMRRNNHEK